MTILKFQASTEQWHVIQDTASVLHFTFSDVTSVHVYRL